MQHLEMLDWDTKFFGRKTARIKNNAITKSNIKKINDEISGRKIKILYYFQDVRNTDNLPFLIKSGLKFVDVEVVLVKDISKEKTGLNSSTIFDILPDKRGVNIASLKSLFTELSEESRFYRDERVDQKKVAELYNLWLENSLNKGYADYFYIIGNKEKPKGFVTYKKTNKDAISLSLINIDKNMRDSGFGTNLVVFSLAQLADRGFRKCTVKTHFSNRVAINFYTSLGFKIKECNYIFHAHF